MTTSKRLPALDESSVPGESPVSFAQRYLTTAYDSVSSLIDQAYPILRGQRTASRGRLVHSEQDLFRAAVVFSGAGVDATLKQALRDCVPTLVEHQTAAEERYLEFVTRYISDGEQIKVKALAELLASHKPGDDLVDAYVTSLTGSSLQSRFQVTNSLSALGFHDPTDKDLFRDAATLDPLFKARNQIAHEMDMTPAALQRRRGARTRRERSIDTYIDLCYVGLNYMQRCSTC